MRGRPRREAIVKAAEYFTERAIRYKQLAESMPPTESLARLSLLARSADFETMAVDCSLRELPNHYKRHGEPR